MRSRILGMAFAAAAGLMAARGPGAPPAGPAALKVTFGAKGVATLVYGGTNLLADGALTVERASFRAPDGTERAGPLTDVRYDGPRPDGPRRVVTARFGWGSVACTYAADADRLTLRLTVTNDSPDTLQGIWVRPLLLRFPELPKGWDPAGHFPNVSFLPGGPRVHTADFGAWALAFVNEDLTRPLIAGLNSASDPPTSRTYPLIIRSSNFGWMDEQVTPRMVRPIPAGGRDQYTVSLRFGPSGTAADRLAGDVYRKFAAAYPPRLRWPDRRPIAAVYLSTSEAPYHSPTNPRGWFMDPKGVDVTTPVGRAAFADRVLRCADESATVMRKTGAQGVIVWDLEGQQYPHATSYLGDPRSLPAEMEPVADAFFARFKAAGFRTGVTVRPQMPVRPAYGDGVAQVEVADPARNLMDKIGHAKKRWGCTLFYIDSNGDPNVPLDEDAIRRVAEAHPDVLLIPEHKTVRYYAYTAPYQSLSYLGVASTPDYVRAVYPEAFSVIDTSKDVTKHRAALQSAVRRGDILMFNSWPDSPETAEVRAIYEEAGGASRP
jgi:hypothetical protein